MPPWLSIIFQPQSAKMETKLSRRPIRTSRSSSSRTNLLLLNSNNLVLSIALLLCLLINCTLCNGLPCQSSSWWDSANNKCIPCTECSHDQLIVLRPCQLHQDTVCGSIQDLEIDYMLLARTEANWKDRLKDQGDHDRDPSIGEDIEQNPKFDAEDEFEDWWEIALILAIVIILLLFIFVVYLSFHHMRQWRQIERRLDIDVEQLSEKLMAKLANVQNIENGNFIIENPIRDATVRPVQVHCVMLDNHYAEKMPLGVQQPGNLYIEETNTK